MNRVNKSILKMALTLMLVFSGVFAFMAVSAEEAPESVPAQTQTQEETKPEKKAWDGKKELTEEQKAAMKAKCEEMKAKADAAKSKWDSLTDEQKNELYALQGQVTADKAKLIEKAKEFGLVNEEDASKIIEGMENFSAKMKEEGKMPMMGRGRGRHCFPKGDAQPAE